MMLRRRLMKAKNSVYFIVALIGLIVLVSGCTNIPTDQQPKNTDSPKPAATEIIKYVCSDGVTVDTLTKCPQSPSSAPRLNCRELNGFMCKEDEICLKKWTNSSDSFCCPEACVSLYNELQNRSVCDDNDPCTFDVLKKYSSLTDYKCIHEKKYPCNGNGVCEQGEVPTGSVEIQPICGNTIRNTRPVSLVQSSDCPSTCNDGDTTTVDYFNITQGRCAYVICKTPVQQNTNSINNVIVNIDLEKVRLSDSTERIGQKILITNNNNNEINVSGGGMILLTGKSKGTNFAWTVLSSESDKQPFTYTQIAPNSKVEGWVFLPIKETLLAYEVGLVNLTIVIDGNTIGFERNITASI